MFKNKVHHKVSSNPDYIEDSSAPSNEKNPLTFISGNMNGNRWIFSNYNKNYKIRHQERYQHDINEIEIPSAVQSENALLVIPDGKFLRKYLTFLEMIQQHSFYNDRLMLVLLESAAELMDHRNISPSISLSNEQDHVESTALNERKRIIELWEEFKDNTSALQNQSSVLAFSDLAYRSKDGEEDEFDLFGFEHMNVENRSRVSLMRAARILSTKGGERGAHICLLTENELLLGSNEQGSPIQSMNCRSFITFLIDRCTKMSEHDKDLLAEQWQSIEGRCQQEYAQRNTVIHAEAGDIKFDNYGHFEYMPDEKLLEGISQKKYFRSVLNVSTANSKEAYCNIQKADGENVQYFLNENHGHFNRSIHGDIVVVEPLPRDQWEAPVGKRRLVASDFEEKSEYIQNGKNLMPTARVVGLHVSNPRRRPFVATMVTIAGTLRRDENAILVVPMNSKIPRIRIRTKIAHGRMEKKRILVEIDEWNTGSSCPTGHFIKIIGDVGDLNTEIACLLKEHRIDLSPFSANALACLPFVEKDGWKIDDEDIKYRRDLRTTCRIFSVDPNGCQDIDDAMHARGECTIILTTEVIENCVYLNY